jgi:chemotaxis protein MotA
VALAGSRRVAGPWLRRFVVAPDVLVGGMRGRVVLRALARTGRAGRTGAVATAIAVVAAATGFLSVTGLVVTIGGTLAVAWVTFPRPRLESTWRLLEEALADGVDPRDLIATFRRLGRIHRVEGVQGLERAAATVADPFLRRALILVLECTDQTELEELLVGEARSRAAEGEAARHVLATLGKLFPAFGLIGTLIGLALLLRNLASADVAAIGPGLGIAVLTTLYGAILSNVVVLPLATRLQAHLAREAQRLQLIIDGVLLVARQEYPTRIERVLRAYLGTLPGARPGDVIRLAGRAA